MNNSTLRVLALLMVALPISASAAFTGYSSASSDTHIDNWDTNQWSWGPTSQQKSNVGAYVSTVNPYVIDAYGIRGANAWADLTTASMGGMASWMSGPDTGNVRAGANADATLQDSFTHSQGGITPFSWTSATTVKFSLEISGSSHLNANETVPEADANVSGLVILYILPHGSWEAGSSVYGNTIKQFSWGLSETSTMAMDANTYGLVPVDGVLSSGGSVNAEFTPGGDFDWLLWFSVGAGGKTGQGNILTGDAFNGSMDFYNTVKVSYAGPVGANVYSSSGVFPGTLVTPPVPEPETYALMLAGLGLVGYAARRRRV